MLGFAYAHSSFLFDVLAYLFVQDVSLEYFDVEQSSVYSQMNSMEKPK